MTESTPHPNPDAPGAPPHRLPAGPGEAPSMKGCVGCIVLALLAVAVFVALHGGSPETDALRQLVPADAILYVETSDAPTLGRCLADSGGWTPELVPSPPVRQSKRLAAYLAGMLGDAHPRDLEMVLDRVRVGAVALAPGEGVRPSWMAIMVLKNPDRVETFLREDLFTRNSRIMVLGVPVDRIETGAGRHLYYRRLGSIFALTPDIDLMRFVLEASVGRSASLAAALRDVPTDRRATTRLLFAPRLWQAAMSSGTATPPLPGLQKGLDLFLPAGALEHLDPNARLLAEGTPGAEGLDLRIRTVRVAAPLPGLAPSTPPDKPWSLWTYLFWIVLSPVLLVAGLILGLCAVTLLLALWFHLVAWRKGELSPVHPPRLPELSPEMREDLGASRRATSPSSDNDADNSSNPPPPEETPS